jgi:hypothetical protein
LNGLKIHDNDISDGFVWWDTTDSCHINGMHIFAAHSGSTINSLEVYNNYLHGEWGASRFGPGHQTSGIRLAGGPGTMPGALVYNNVVTQPLAGDCPANGYIFFAPSGSSSAVYNNTVVGGTTQCSYGIWVHFASLNVILKNNIIKNTGRAIVVNSDSSLSASNTNLFYNIVGFDDRGTLYETFAAWQGTGRDTHSVLGDPKLDSTFHLLAGSPAIGLSVNLTSLGVTALNYDKSGVARPASGVWDAGAYVFISNRPAPPTGLRVQ